MTRVSTRTKPSAALAGRGKSAASKTRGGSGVSGKDDDVGGGSPESPARGKAKKVARRVSGRAAQADGVGRGRKAGGGDGTGESRVGDRGH